MSYTISDSVPGVDTAELARYVEEAEAGYDLSDLPWMPNPHAATALVVPADIAKKVREQAVRRSCSPEDLVKEALERYLA
ncbi:hypothetical protein [Actinomyces timonensis]|uniref:hypothetical protein n=1 Tax=Actinomyces timonensis TaxID=1288391 RepID=UPI00031E823E|nr:hypothetical protein [Actinomyces timonensis]